MMWCVVVVVVFCAACLEVRMESPQAICCVVGRTGSWARVSNLARLKRPKLWKSLVQVPKTCVWMAARLLTMKSNKNISAPGP